MHKQDLFPKQTNRKKRKKKAVAVVWPASANSTEPFRGNMIYLNPHYKRE